MSRWLTISTFWAGIFLLGCVEEFTPELPSAPERLVVEGRITNESGPYTVKLSSTESLNFENDQLTGTGLSGATVTIFSDRGEEEHLVETSPGVYQTAPDGIRGQVGRQYQLAIRTASGAFYQSRPEVMLPVSPIDSVFFSFEQRAEPIPTSMRQNDAIVVNFDGSSLEDPNNFVPDVAALIPVGEAYRGVAGTIVGADLLTEDTFEESKEGVQLKVATQDPLGERNYYQWSVQGTFELRSTPGSFIVTGRPEGIDPPLLYIQVPKSCCQTCWVHFDLPSLFLESDRLVDGNAFQKELTLFPTHKFLFHRHFYVEIEQASLSFEAFNFYEGILKQINEVGSIFDSAPKQLLSNVSNENNPEEQVVGFFVVSAISRSGRFISREELPVDLGLFEHPDDCREVGNDIMTSVTERPEFWPE